MKLDSDKLKTENTNLVAAYREKQRKHQQTQELYDRLKRREMTSATQSAAFESADDVLGTSHYRHEYGAAIHSRQHPTSQERPAQREFQPPHLDHNGIEQVHSHQRSESNNGQGSSGSMPPPPLIRRPGVTSGAVNNSESYLPGSRLASAKSFPANAMATPSNHRTQLGPVVQSSSHSNGRSSANMASRNSQNHVPAQRQPFASKSGNPMERHGMNGYGMSAGMKVGRQQTGENVLSVPSYRGS